MLRHNRTALGVLFIAGLFLMLGAAFVVLRLFTPYDGAPMQPGADAVWQSNGVVISPFDEQTNGLRKGDLVVAVDGRSLESYAQSLFDWSVPHPQWSSSHKAIYTVVRDGRTVNVALTPTSYPFAAVLVEEWGAIVFAIAILLVAGFVFFKRPDERVARVLFLGAAGMASATTWSFGLQVSDLVGALGWWLYFVTTTGGYLMIWIAMLHLALVFPQPLPIVLRWRWLIPVSYLAPYTIQFAMMTVTRLTITGALQWLATMGGASGPIQLVYVTLAIIAGVHNYRSSRDSISRRQVRWVLFAAGAAGITGLVFGVIPELVMGQALLSWSVLALFGLLVPLALAFAILRYRLFDIDILINRTLVYGTLSALFIAVYIVVVGSLSALFHTSGNLLISMLATGIVAVLFQPLRESLQRGVNRLMYGERDEPYAVLSRLGQRLEATLAGEAVLPTIVETVAQALKLPYAAIALTADGRLQTAATYPSSAVGGPPSSALRLPLVYQHETLGELVVAPRAGEDKLSSADLSLLNDLARQAGIAAHAVRLATDLQRSRERLVTTREEERRRIRRDLHDGLGPALASLTLKLDATRNLLSRDPQAADQLLAELKTQTQHAIADIRRLVYDLRPPALDELGLVAAIRERAMQYDNLDGLRVCVDAPEYLPSLPAAVEVATYRIALEALTNAARHAQARACVLSLCLNGGLEIEVMDDGVGMGPDTRSGVGLASMRERAAELGGTCVIEPRPGGGTRVLARLPLASETNG